MTRRLHASVIVLMTLCLPAAAQVPALDIRYELSAPQPSTHLFEIGIHVTVPEGAAMSALDFQMARWSPGRYAIADFAKNVQEFEAASDAGPLPVLRTDDQTWRVAAGSQRSVRVRYKVFANDLSGTFAQLDSGHASYNGAELFMYLAGFKPNPVSLEIRPPAGWRLMHGRMSGLDERRWTFDNWDILVDTPTEIGPDWTVDEFSVAGRRYRVMIHSRGPEGGRRAAFVRDVEKIVRAQTAMMGDPDFDSYTFLIHFAADDRSGDGMEHLTSTQIISPGALGDPGTYESTLGTVSHEFFHVWNVKRLRPAGLGPWDFTKPVVTKGLWIAEGFTNYYGKLMERRAGVTDDAGFFADLANTISSIENAPGSRLISAEESSLIAPFLDRGSSRQRTNLANTSFSYYPKGELLGFVMDLLIRGRSQGRRSLDDVMRRMYDEFYVKSPNDSYYLKGRAFSNEDFERVATDVAGFDLSAYFSQHVRGVAPPPYDEALRHVGLRLIRAPVALGHTAGIHLDNSDLQNVRVDSLRPGSAGEAAGIESGDVVVSIAGTPVNRDNWRRILNQHRPGDMVQFSLRRRRTTIEKTVRLGEPDLAEYRITEDPGATATQRSLRTAWLSSTR